MASSFEAALKIGLAGHTFLNCRALKGALRRVGLWVEWPMSSRTGFNGRSVN